MRRATPVLSALVVIAGAAPLTDSAQTTVESAQSHRPDDEHSPEPDQRRRELQYAAMGASAMGTQGQAAMGQMPSLLAATVNAYQSGRPQGASPTPIFDAVQSSVATGVQDFSLSLAQYMAPFMIDNMLPAGTDPVDLVRQLLRSRDLMTESINFITGIEGVPAQLYAAGMLPISQGVLLEQPVLPGMAPYAAKAAPYAAGSPYAAAAAPAYAVSTPMPAQSSLSAGPLSALSWIFGRR